MKEVIKSLLQHEIARKVEEFREMKLYTSVASEKFFAFPPDCGSNFDPQFVTSYYFEGLLEALVQEDSEHYGELHKVLLRRRLRSHLKNDPDSKKFGFYSSAHTRSIRSLLGSIVFNTRLARVSMAIRPETSQTLNFNKR
jgi:hypothetical protein